MQYDLSDYDLEKLKSAASDGATIRDYDGLCDDYGSDALKSFVDLMYKIEGYDEA